MPRRKPIEPSPPPPGPRTPPTQVRYRAPFRCPQCREELTDPVSVEVIFRVANHTFAVSSTVDEAGFLKDTPDRAIAHGFFLMAECGYCGRDLQDIEVPS